MAKFTNTPPDWKATGVEPDDNLKTQGFVAGYKPPAAFFNWFWNKVSNCLKEFFDKSAGVTHYDQNGNAMGEVFNDYENNTAKGSRSHAEGSSTHASGDRSHAEGFQTTASGNSAHCQGSSTNKADSVISDLETASKDDILYGWERKVFSLARGNSAHAEGANSLALGDFSHAEGELTKALDFSDHAEGEKTTASGQASHAEGCRTVASGVSSHSQNFQTTAFGHYSHCEGFSKENAVSEVSDLSSETSFEDIIEVWEGDYTKFGLAFGEAAHSEGMNCLALGEASHAEGNETIASGYYAHSEGNQTTASGLYAHAEGNKTVASGQYSHAEGNQTTASGTQAHAEGYGTVASGYYSHAAGYGTVARNYQTVVGKYNTSTDSPVSQNDTSGSVLVVGGGTSDTERRNAFRVATDGSVYGLSSYNSTGADYAEYFEWLDENANNEDRRGYFVTLQGDKIRKATNTDDYILGIISATGAFIGDSASEEWQGKYLTDVYGTPLKQEVKIPESVDEETGEVITPAHTVIQFVVNPEYNSEQEYQPRENRKEWDAVGLLGKIVLIDDGTCNVGGWCKANANGTGTHSEEKTDFYVLERLDENHIKVFVK